MTVYKTTADVFFGGRRRWFSLAAACRGEANAFIKRLCDCESGDNITPPITCRLHRDPVRLERLMNWLAARARRRAVVQSAPSAPEERALAACRELLAARKEVERISHLIGDNLNACPLMQDPIEYGPKGPILHLSMAYASEDVENDHYAGTHKEWLEESEKKEILETCPHCLAAHNAIQERKLARRRLGAARRAITLIGKS